MVCQNCGQRCTGDRCETCARVDRCEARHGDSVPDPDDEADDEKWTVEQTGLGGDAEGQSTLGGGIRKPTGGEE